MSDQHAMIAAHMRDHQRQYRPKVYDLLSAGWSMELPLAVENMARWRWFRPSRVPGERGGYFGNTDAAHRYLVRKGKA
jgi:hypothetical protein